MCVIQRNAAGERRCARRCLSYIQTLSPPPPSLLISAAYSATRPSLGTGGAGDDGPGGGRFPARRRWAPLQHFKGERVKYTESGAVVAEKLGVPTPVLDRHASRLGGGAAAGAAERKRSRSKSGSRTAGAAAERGRPAKRPRHASIEDDEAEPSTERAPSRGRGSAAASSSAPVPGGLSAKEAKALKAKVERLEQGVKGTRAQEQMPLSHLPPGFAEAPSSNLVISASNGHPMYQIGECADTASATNSAT